MLRQAPKKEADTFDLDEDDEDDEDVEEAEEFEKDYNFRFEVEEGRQGIGKGSVDPMIVDLMCSLDILSQFEMIHGTSCCVFLPK